MSATAAAKKQRVQVEADDDESTNSDVAKALEHVNGIVDKITNLFVIKGGEKPAPADGDEGGDGSEGAGDDDADETDTEKAAKSLKSVLAKCGMDAAMSKQVYGALKAAGFDLSAKAGGPPFPPKPKGKGAAAADDGDEEEKKTSKNADEYLTMENLASAVQKAAAFTPARIAQLKSAQEILKLVLEAVTPGTSPDASTPAVGTFPNTSAVADLAKPNTKPSVPTMKSSDPDLVVTAIKNLAGVVDGLVDRVTSIEKARPGSNSVTEDGGTDSRVKKSNLWSGVL